MIPRHKTAIRRPGFSLPIKCLLRDGLLDSSRYLFDYGCGHGQDIDLLTRMGIACDGWDPVYRADTTKTRSQVINLGYVLNVIEDPVERKRVLQQAWDLCDDLLVVSALGGADASDTETGAFYSDGILTSRGTFQKHYTHQELRAYLQDVLLADAIPAAPNVFYVFKGEEARQQFLSRRCHRSAAIPQKRLSEQLFECHKDLLNPFMATLSQLGRFPGPEELPEYAAIEAAFGSLKRAFQIVLRVTGKEPWEEMAVRRKEDLLVYLALARFGTRRPLSRQPLSVQRDIKAFAGTYKKATEDASKLLFSVGNPEAIDLACQQSQHGYLVDNALIVTRSSLEELSPTLRVFEGCARALLGEIDEANVIKLHRYSGKVTYLVCQGLESNSNPEILLRIKVNLRNLDINFYDYSRWSPRPNLK